MKSILSIGNKQINDELLRISTVVNIFSQGIIMSKLNFCKFDQQFVNGKKQICTKPHIIAAGTVYADIKLLRLDNKYYSRIP